MGQGYAQPAWDRLMGNKVNIAGHVVDPEKHDLDYFFSGRDGSAVSDAEWDESKRRLENAEMLDSDPDNPLVTWIPIRDYNGDGGDLGTDTK